MPAPKARRNVRFTSVSDCTSSAITALPGRSLGLGAHCDFFERVAQLQVQAKDYAKLFERRVANRKHG